MTADSPEKGARILKRLRREAAGYERLAKAKLALAEKLEREWGHENAAARESVPPAPVADAMVLTVLDQAREALDRHFAWIVHDYPKADDALYMVQEELDRIREAAAVAQTPVPKAETDAVAWLDHRAAALPIGDSDRAAHEQIAVVIQDLRRQLDEALAAAQPVREVLQKIDAEIAEADTALEVATQDGDSGEADLCRGNRTGLQRAREVITAATSADGAVREVLSAAPKTGLMREALEAIKIRLHFLGMPNEPMRHPEGGGPPRPDWRKEIALLEAALAIPSAGSARDDEVEALSQAMTGYDLMHGVRGLAERLIAAGFRRAHAPSADGAVRETLREAIGFAEHVAPQPAHGGSCHPDAGCDGDCVVAARHAEMVARWRRALSAAPSPAPSPVPSRIDPEVSKNGTPICVLAGPSPSVLEATVVAASKAVGAKIDWGYCGGRASVKTLGDPQQSANVLAAQIPQVLWHIEPDLWSRGRVESASLASREKITMMSLPSDMGGEDCLRVVFEDDGDVILTVYHGHRDLGSVQFCTSGTRYPGLALRLRDAFTQHQDARRAAAQAKKETTDGH